MSSSGKCIYIRQRDKDSSNRICKGSVTRKHTREEEKEESKSKVSTCSQGSNKKNTSNVERQENKLPKTYTSINENASAEKKRNAVTINTKVPVESLPNTPSNSKGSANEDSTTEIKIREATSSSSCTSTDSSDSKKSDQQKQDCETPKDKVATKSKNKKSSQKLNKMSNKDIKKLEKALYESGGSNRQDIDSALLDCYRSIHRVTLGAISTIPMAQNLQSDTHVCHIAESDSCSELECSSSSNLSLQISGCNIFSKNKPKRVSKYYEKYKCKQEEKKEKKEKKKEEKKEKKKREKAKKDKKNKEKKMREKQKKEQSRIHKNKPKHSNSHESRHCPSKRLSGMKTCSHRRSCTSLGSSTGSNESSKSKLTNASKDTKNSKSRLKSSASATDGLCNIHDIISFAVLAGISMCCVGDTIVKSNYHLYSIGYIALAIYATIGTWFSYQLSKSLRFRTTEKIYNAAFVLQLALASQSTALEIFGRYYSQDDCPAELYYYMLIPFILPPIIYIATGTHWVICILAISVVVAVLTILTFSIMSKKYFGIGAAIAYGLSFISVNVVTGSVLACSHKLTNWLFGLYIFMIYQTFRVKYVDETPNVSSSLTENIIDCNQTNGI